MFDFIKKLSQKKEKNKAFVQAQDWKSNALLQECLASLRGECTVADSAHQEACEAMVFLAQTEGRWSGIVSLDDLPENWMTESVYIVWDEMTLPVLYCTYRAVAEHIADVTAVAFETWLICDDMERIIHFDDLGRIRISGDSPEVFE